MALIGLAHGSRHPGVSAVVDDLMQAVGAALGVEARVAFLDLTEPDLNVVAAELAAAGHRSAVVVPLLFTVAFHAKVDVPQAVAEAAATSGLELLTADILGADADLAELLVQDLAAPAAAGSAPVLLYAVGSSDAGANAAVVELADRLERATSRPTRAGFATCEPRAAAVAAELASASQHLIVLPLFLAPGRLLESVTERAADQGWTMLSPLGRRTTPLVVQRYRDRLRAPHGPVRGLG